MSKFSNLFRLFNKYVKILLLGNVAYARSIGVKIGTDCRIYTTSFGSEPFLIEIGDRVTVTAGVKLLTHDGSTWLIRRNGKRFQRFGRIKIGSEVFVGVNAIVMPGVKIGSRVVIGAGSVVTKDVPDNSVFVGNPAVRISSFDNFERKIKENCVNNDDLARFGSYRERVEFAVQWTKNAE